LHFAIFFGKHGELRERTLQGVPPHAYQFKKLHPQDENPVYFCPKTTYFFGLGVLQNLSLMGMG